MAHGTGKLSISHAQPWLPHLLINTVIPLPKGDSRIVTSTITSSIAFFISLTHKTYNSCHRLPIGEMEGMEH